jgi:hypothetical protein
MQLKVTVPQRRKCVTRKIAHTSWRSFAIFSHYRSPTQDNYDRASDDTAPDRNGLALQPSVQAKGSAKAASTDSEDRAPNKLN